MIRIALTLVFVGFANLFLWAQSGHYFLTHYKPGSDKLNYLSYDIHQDDHGILFFANRSGVLQFDGRTWTQIPAQGAIFTITASDDGEIYAGGSSGFGRITRNEKNLMEYQSLSDSLAGVRNVFASLSKSEAIYFLNETKLFKVVGTVASVVLTASPKEGTFTGMYAAGNSLFVNTENEGIKLVDGKSLIESSLLPGENWVLSEPSHDGKTYFIATERNKYFLYREGAKPVEIMPKDADYLRINVVANATWINERIVVLGTLRGGVIFLDVETFETVETTNYLTGLPDNEVYAIHTDRHLGVWIAHEYGFTRIAPFLPFRTYNHYPGLAGNLLCVQSFRGALYVGTSLGLFSLTRQDIYGTESYEVLKTIQEAHQAEQVAEPVVTERKKSRRGFLGLGKKKVEEPVQAPQQPKSPVTKKPKKRTKIQMERRVLRGTEHVFMQVLGIAGKVDQLIIVGDKLVAGGVSGVFEVKDLVAVPLTPSPSRAIYYSRNLEQLLVSTYNNNIMAFRSARSGWVDADFPDSLSMYADYFFEDNAQNLWVCGRDRVLRIGTDDGILVDAEEVPLPYTSIDKTVGLSYGQDVYITQNGEFFHYLSFKNTFVKFDSLPGPKKYFASSGAFWFYDGHRWRTVDRRNQGELRTEWLALFPDIRFLAPAESGKSLWVITANNDLYKFSSEFETAAPESNPLFLKEVRNQQSKLSPGSLRVSENESALTFEFIQPEYVGMQAVEYHYWVKGLQATWSEWSSVNNVINFPFLNPGNYSVMVESRDLFGKITRLETIELSVVPPYWKRPAFYALEFVVFGFLVVFSMRLNVSSTRFRYLSQFLSTLTVVLLIQFIQVIVAANVELQSTPVADFFVQVVIALLVLPVENFLRSRMIRASERTRR